MSFNYDVILSPAYLWTFTIISVICIIGMWKLFAKAGQPGWAAIVPFYNNYLLSKIALGNGWLFLLTFIPIVSFFYMIYLEFKLANTFNKSGLFALGLILFPFIFYLILGFDSSQYSGPNN